MQIGQINYVRPSSPVEFEDVEHILTMSGKDLIRIAWSSLNPNSSNEIKGALGCFFKSYFNLKDGDGTKCVNLLINLGLLGNNHRSYQDYYYPKFKL
ncbi:hypothetical protein SMSP2_01808 [Limihaloglobus sulfuriphilus]|uniref:Uncharacterized protein n=1 Tax=Limihaloglobus sulfuriphilus TaxID=1851148 RepID=A0A1Q2MFK8_9BACT|nr:hypothetical protein SMSP2_01808 [Limihaloglobus sulfuriphilus]